MVKKQGITLIAATVTIIVMLIIAGTITISTYSTISYARKSTWANEIQYIQDTVDEMTTTTTSLPYTTDTVIVDLTGLSTEEIAEQFEGETIENNSVELNVLNLGALRITNTVHGNYDTTNDVYAYSLTTGKVYYAQGFEIDDKVYYTLTDSLKSTFKLTPATGSLSAVVFVPNVIGYTNTPIKVTIKVPTKFTQITVTTSNANVLVGEQKTVEDIYEYEVNTGNFAGNYEITVKYTRGTQSYTTKYTVNTYDVTAPVINGIEYDNVVYTETDTNVSEYISNITATDASGIKLLKYTLGTIVENDAQEYFRQNGNNIVNGKINLDRTNTIYTVYVEDYAGNFSVTTFDKMYLMPEEWTASVSYIHAHVPIPKGFVASPYYDENKVNGGLVIYELTDAEIQQNATTLPNTEDQFTSWTGRNQYVWIPVDDFSKFKRQLYAQEGTISNELGVTDVYWEVILDEYNIPNIDENKKYSNFITIGTTENGTTNTLDETVAMYSSVKKYGGFYIARYEAGVSIETDITNIIKGANVYSMMGKKPYNTIAWASDATMNNDLGGVVEVSRSIYPVNDKTSKYGVVSTLIYGVQWDATMNWWKSRGINIYNKDGNYFNQSISSKDKLNKGTMFSQDQGITYELVDENYTKDTQTLHILTTGALKIANKNNIYDMAGNMWEYTMEGHSTTNRVIRGGGVNEGGTGYVAYRHPGYFPTVASETAGFRIALYIKLPTT